MVSIGTGYDLTAAQFSPDGRIFQLEYAQKAVENSGTIVALKGKDGVVFAVEKIIKSKLYEESANKRIFTVDKHIGMAIGGYIADGRHIVKMAHNEASHFRSIHGYAVPLKLLKDRVSMDVHLYTLYSSYRPFGASVLMSSYENEVPELYRIVPSGLCHSYHGCSIGKAHQAAKSEMDKLNLSDISLDNLVEEAAKIIYQVHDEIRDRNFQLQLSWVGRRTNGIHELVPDPIFREVQRKVAIHNSDSEEDL